MQREVSDFALVLASLNSKRLNEWCNTLSLGTYKCNPSEGLNARAIAAIIEFDIIQHVVAISRLSDVVTSRCCVVFVQTVRGVLKMSVGC